MLVDDDAAMRPDMILMLVATVENRLAGARKLAPGVYQVGHFGSSDWPTGYKQGWEINDLKDKNGDDFCLYGVCDNWEQIVELCPYLQTSERKFIITLTTIEKSAQDASGGWRWRKWGPYIGTRTPTAEYLYDEPDIDKVYVFHVYEKSPGLQ